MGHIDDALTQYIRATPMPLAQTKYRVIRCDGCQSIIGTTGPRGLRVGTLAGGFSGAIAGLCSKCQARSGTRSCRFPENQDDSLSIPPSDEAV